LGDTLSVAKGRAAEFKGRYGAINPIFDTDKQGRVVRECWAAPPEEWTKSQAMSFAAELVPAALRKEQPKVLPKDGGQESFVYSDGTTVLIVGWQAGRYIQVEVHAKGFTGTRC